MSFFRIRDVPAPLRREIDAVAEATGASRRAVVESLLDSNSDEARDALLEGFLLSFLMAWGAGRGPAHVDRKRLISNEARIQKLVGNAAAAARRIVSFVGSEVFDERADIAVAELDDGAVAGIRSLAEEFGLPPPIAARFLIQARAGTVSERVQRAMFPDHQKKDATS